MTERTILDSADEQRFLEWARQSGIKDVDHPASRYDYRGYWKSLVSRGRTATKNYADGLHFTDQFKQHGHPSFSIESQYSAGPWDGGRWRGESYVPPGADMLSGPGGPRLDSEMLAKALSILARRLDR